MKLSPDARPERWLGALALAVISLISLGNVVTRYVTGGSLAFTEEFSVFLLVVLTFTGASVALRRNGHIRIGLLERALPTAPRRALILFQGLSCAIVLGLITWYGAKLTWEEYQWESLSPGLGLPQWWYLVWLPLLSATMLVRLAQQLLDRWRGRLDDEP
ncbi:TRAP transporter small permease [Halomonas sp. MCCC 1A17488]|uniref:TRAP transporter small permease protein n=1 Tax=Billgrantia sulfidoxydans TaxID=2733484 RepID=A0ABX7W6R7_9GAMM|nr:MULTISPECIES: TRAP transporter small permease [Halomonas]MCE8017530.1 TRAP transporter small permease [Halomonas sp. MCCC 1A17488]MCG3240863.1 TRAP transporter small permease [Halomonas sp. MCCC 1A17488]QPP48738.1 TRAP transporter small permease [Halomonas sp. SS10-MC5]QTP56078.1 TRAP transporter small permease [Halomonas sulfidoxydans]